MTVHTPILRPGAHSRRQGHRRLPLLVTVPLWIVVAGLAGIALMRLVAWDDFGPLAVANALNGVLYLVAWPIVVVAAVGRRFLLAAAALIVVIAQVLFVLPELTAAGPIPTWAAHAPTIRLLDANVYNANPSMAGYVREIRSVHPQLVTMEEATPADVGQLVASGALDHLPYRYEVSLYDPGAFLIASQYPLGKTDVVSYYRRPLIVRTTIELPSGPQTLWVVHTTAPLPQSFAEWQGMLATVGRLVRSRGPAGLLLVGDFNATWGNRGFRSILDAGLTDGAAARGRALDMTWSQMMSVVPPLVRIDHVLTGAGVAVTRISTGDGPGSDHRDLVATVAIRRQPGPS